MTESFTHTECDTTLSPSETGALFSCPECGVDVGVEETGAYTQ